MTPTEAASIVAVFVAAFPTSPADEATVTLWCNALAPTDFAIARTAALDVVRTTSWWPSIAEFNARVTELRRDEARRTTPSQIAGRLRCDGTGWIDRGHEHEALEPCPACNPWLRTQWEEGDLHAGHRPKAPADFVMPSPCRRTEHALQVSADFGCRLALAAYRDACATDGRAPTESIIATLERGDIPFASTAGDAA